MFLKTHFLLLFFLIVLIVHIYLSSIGLSFPLADPHGFRQAQTAITVYYFLTDGLRLDYWTPALGSPWSIPMEFPLFQIIVALFVKLTHLPLDMAGRLISLTFFYAMLPVLFNIFGKLNIPRNHRFILLSFILLCPIYLFWSRTFLLESLALTLCILYFFFVIKAHEIKNSFLYASLALTCGIIASIVKITTFVLILLPIIIYCYSETIKKIHSKKSQQKFLIFYKEIIRLIIFIGLPFITSIIWILYADSIKNQNPLANGFLTSKDMIVWNYGTLTQKLSLQTWIGILEHIKNSIIGMPILIIIPIITYPLNPKYRVYSLVSLLTFLVGPIIFTNLYYIHDYYYYANGMFLILAIGFSFIGTLSRVKYAFPARIIVCIAFLLLLIQTYKKTYYPAQSSPNYGLVQVGNAIKKYTHKDDIILIYGHVWSPEIPYYAQRKAIMDMWGLPLSNQKIAQSIALSNKDNITAMFVRLYPDEFVKERITYFNFDENPVFISPWGILYIKKL